MKKLYMLIILICALQGTVLAQRIVHHSYTTYYNAQKKLPDSVSYDLTAAMVDCTPQVRRDLFKPDPRLSASARPEDYDQRGFSKGLLFGFKNAACNSTDIIECFYTSNLLPINSVCYNSDWQAIENYERTLALNGKIHVITGGWGAMPETTKGGLTIPKKIWKAIYADGKWLVWIVDNSGESTGHDFKYWMKTTEQLNYIAGLDL